MRNQFSDAKLALAFILSGRARFTVVSKRTGQRFTFKVTSAKGETDNRHFVSVLTGSDNESSYTYLGTIFDQKKYSLGKKSKFNLGTPCHIAFNWIWNAVNGATLPDTCEIWHEGCCGRCGRALTVPESIASGIGPVCEEKIAA